jgi:two-component system osmolarity sensor histidine kinase EnvZ
MAVRRGLIKRLLPSTFLGRSVMIIVMPLILLQVVSTWIFYDRHWETVTRRLAGAVAGEVAMVIEGMRRFPGKENEARVLTAASVMNLRLAYRRGEILPNVAPEIGSGILDRRLSKALEEQIRRPFHMDTWTYDRQVRIKVQLPDGVLDVFVSRERLFSSTTYIFIMWMVGTSMVLFAIASIFMRNQVRPIRRLAAAADSFGKGRDVPNIKPEGATEIRTAAAAFNLMRERIQRSIAQRTEMLAGVSHDLRTPLTRMKLQLAMLGGDTGSGVDDLKADLAEMENMVEEYLSFARGEGTEAVVDADINEIVDDVVAGARREGATIDLESEPEMIVPVRPNAFKRCLTNLVTNAMVHADHVAVKVCRNDVVIEVTIDDDGPGIPSAQREEVFRPFYRLDSARNLDRGGSGLGLTIARDVMRGHGGDLRLEEAPLGGLRARLRLPI